MWRLHLGGETPVSSRGIMISATKCHIFHHEIDRRSQTLVATKVWQQSAVKLFSSASLGKLEACLCSRILPQNYHWKFV